MGKPFLLCNVNRFKTDAYNLPMQQELEITTEGVPEIWIKPEIKKFYQSFDQYYCHHEYKHRKFGRIRDITFHYYFEPVDFYAYYDKSLNLCILQVKTDIALDYIDKLNTYSEYDLKAIEMDFSQMYSKLPYVSGAWVGQLKDTNIKTKGLFGNNVHESEEFKIAASVGKVSGLNLNFISQITNEEHYINISSKGSITLYDTFNTLQDELDIIMEIYKKLISPQD